MSKNIQTIDPISKEFLTLTQEGFVRSDGNTFPFKAGAYRFVKDDNYTKNFGYQWNKFDKTQIDKSANIQMSENRFFAETGWDNEDLSEKNILEVGSGAGRFSQIILDHTNANLYSVDYSNAVAANYKNNGPHVRLHLYQASIYELPFAPASFDKVICLGVLQHTPDVEQSIKCLVDMVAPGGEVIVDFYPINGWWSKVNAKYILRPITKKWSHEKLFSKINKNADWLIRTSQFFSKIGLGKLFNRFLPVCDIEGTMPNDVDEKTLREMVVLDTFDMFSPQYDQPQRVNIVVAWFKKYGMKEVWSGNVTYDNCKATLVKGIKE